MYSNVKRFSTLYFVTRKDIQIKVMIPKSTYIFYE